MTGASGMFGRAFCRQAASANVIIGLSQTGREGTTACDLSDAKALAALWFSEKPDLVVNTAAYSDVDGCERDPARARAANALGVKNLADLCGKAGAPLVHVSTDYVFDGLKSSPYVEEDAVAPVNIYGLTKLEGEYHASRCKAPSAVVRTSWLFGPGNDANFVNALAARLKKENTVSVLDDQTDAPTYVEDLGLAIQAISERLIEKGGGAEVYHVCNSGSATRHEMTVAMKEILGLGTEVKVTDRSQIKGRLAVRPPYVVMSNRRFVETFSMPLRPWRDSLKEYLLN